MRIAIALNLAFLFHAASSLATTYQVGPSRTDKTIDAVSSRLGPGDVVEVDGDATYPGGIVLDQPGASGNPITIRGVLVNGKRPVLSGGTNTIEIQGDHYVLEGFDITAGSFRCVYHHSNDVVMRDLVVHDCAAHGLLGADQGSGSLTLEYSEFYGSGSGTGEHQIYMATDEVAHPGSVFRMQHCYVHDGAGGNNVKSRAERNEIYYNWIEGAMYHELELIGPDPGGAPAGWTEDLVREDSDVVGNVLRKRETSFVVRFGGDGTGQSNGRYRFVNNTVLTEPGGSAVFRLFDGIESVEMHGNVFFVDPNPAGSSNLVRDAEAVWSTGSRVVGGSNNWVLTQATNVPPEWTSTLTGGDPQFVATATMDLRPAAGSPLLGSCGCASSPPGHDFPSPLARPLFDPPLHAIEAVGAAVPRPSSGPLDIGALQSGSPSDAGGASGSGGAAATGGASGSGGSASGGSGNGGGLGAGGSSSGGGASSDSGTGASGSGGTDAGAPGAFGTSSAGAATVTGGPAGAGGDQTPTDSGCGCHLGNTRPLGSRAFNGAMAALVCASRFRKRRPKARRS